MEKMIEEGPLDVKKMKQILIYLEGDLDIKSESIKTGGSIFSKLFGN